MLTHQDSDSEVGEWLRSLQTKAETTKAIHGSQITTGDPPIEEWETKDFTVQQLPDDEHGILRISIGGGDTPLPINYLVFRGDHSKCVDLLRKALKSLER